jgi:hypothetical protein
MSIEQSIKQLVKKTLDEEKQCTEQRAEQIAQQAVTDIYDRFNTDIESLNNDLNKLQDRQDRMWDLLHQNPPSRLSRVKRFFGRFLWWRR